MASTSSLHSSLYDRINVLRAVFPLGMAIVILSYEVIEHVFVDRAIAWHSVLIEFLIFGLALPVLSYKGLSWLAQRVGERDEAEVRLAEMKAHERQLLEQVERTLQTEQLGLVPTLNRILADVVAQHAGATASVYLQRHDGEEWLEAVASWPDPSVGPMLMPHATALLQSAEDTWFFEDEQWDAASTAREDLIAVPIIGEGRLLGAFVLAGQPGGLPAPSVLSLIASTIGLLVRNSALYARLESQVVVEERNRLAREVHDGIAQSLGFLNFKVQQVQRLHARGQLAETATALEQLRDGTQEAYSDVRLLIQGLRWTMGGQGGLAEQLERYGSVVAERTGLQVIVEAAGMPDELDLTDEAQRQLFRIAQEALSNVHRHARASRAIVRLEDRDGGITLSVEDDGTGFELPTSEDGDHFGLRIMRERVQSIGGEFQVMSRPGEGTTVRAWVPHGAANAGYGGELWSASAY